ncbi:MAG: hypothetical protein K0B52_04400 [FCB group bacterium]|nr:hypothetical protein [FCB group bacterium]
MNNKTCPTIEELEAELKTYREERERIKDFIGKIGGRTDAKNDKIINSVFFISIFLLMVFDIVRHALELSIPLPPLFSVEVAIFLVSIKIVWMIHRQTKVNHFEFWTLNSIEYRINNLSRQMNELEQKIEEANLLNNREKN